MKRSGKTSVFYYSLIGLAVLPGCDYFKSKKDSDSQEQSSAIKPDDNSTVLLTVSGRPVITINSLNDDINELVEMDQQAKMLMMFDPEGTRERFFREQKRLVLMEEWALREGIHQSQEYQAELERIMRQVKRQLDFRNFLDRHKVDVTDEDAQRYYDENKDQDYRILVSPAGIKTQAVEFANQAHANEFAVKVREAGAAELETIAKSQNLLVRNMGNLNENSYTDKVVKDAVLPLQKFPKVLVVEDQDKHKFWVVAAQSKESAKYQEFDKIKEQLKQMLMPRKISEMLDIEIPKYATQFEAVENTSYFEDAKKAREAAQKAEDEAEPEAENNDTD